MTKWRIPIESYIIVEADTPDQAVREFLACQEAEDCTEETSDIKHDLLMNGQAGKPSVEEPWEE